MDPDRFKLNDAALEGAYKQVYDFYARNRASLTFPRMAILSAQPGAGKSTVFSMIESQFDPDKQPVHVDIDATREFNDHLDEIFEEDPFATAYYTNNDSWLLTKRLLDDSKAARNNVIYETTLRSVRDIEEIIKGFQSERFVVDLHALAVNSKTSVLGIHSRFEDLLAASVPARWTPIEYHDEAYAAFPRNVHYLEKTAGLEFVSVYTRDGVVLYDNGKNQNKCGAQTSIEAERNRIWLPKEKEVHLARWQRVARQVQARPAGRTKPDWYVSGVLAFLKEAELYNVSESIPQTWWPKNVRLEAVTHHHVFVKNGTTGELFATEKTSPYPPLHPSTQLSVRKDSPAP